MRLLLWSAIGLLGLHVLVSPSHATVKVIAKMGDLFFASGPDGSEVIDQDGTKVCADVTLTPFGSTEPILTGRECGDRSAATSANICGALRTRIIARAAARTPPITLVTNDVPIQGCPQ